MKLFLVLALGVIAFFMFKEEISLYAGKAKRVAEASSSVSSRAGDIERVGGKRTPADLRWISEMNVLCARRNSQESLLVGPEDDTTRSLARYAARTLAIWDRYARRAAAVRIPETYVTEANVLRTADQARRRGIEAVLLAARSGDRAGSHSAIDSFGEVSERMRSHLVNIGLNNCADFDP